MERLNEGIERGKHRRSNNHQDGLEVVIWKSHLRRHAMYLHTSGLFVDVRTTTHRVGLRLLPLVQQLLCLSCYGLCAQRKTCLAAFVGIRCPLMRYRNGKLKNTGALSVLTEEYVPSARLRQGCGHQIDFFWPDVPICQVLWVRNSMRRSI